MAPLPAVAKTLAASRSLSAGTPEISSTNAGVYAASTSGCSSKPSVRSAIAERTEGFDEQPDVLAAYTPAFVEEISGVPADKLREAARVFATAGKGAIFYSMGITQHSHGTENVLALSNLALLTGNFGRHAGDLLDERRRVRRQHVGQLVEALRALGDEPGVGQALLEDDVHETVHDCDVRTG